MKPITPQESRQNIELAHRVIAGEPAEIVEQVGILALGQLADLLPSPDFEKFINDAVHHATTGEQPQDQPQQQQDQTTVPQPTPAQ